MLKNAADAVVFDPPCSALGTRPKIFIQESYSQLQDYHQNQRRLFPFVNELIKSGGFLMYNTCTLPKPENEGMVAHILSNYPYKLISVPNFLPFLGQSGLKEENLSMNDCQKLRRFIPTKNKGTGYFIALFQKL
jgi:16S rRNA (cytosine967-C5)-methyltransferase